MAAALPGRRRARRAGTGSASSALPAAHPNATRAPKRRSKARVADRVEGPCRTAAAESKAAAAGSAGEDGGAPAEGGRPQTAAAGGGGVVAVGGAAPPSTTPITPVPSKADAREAVVRAVARHPRHARCRRRDACTRWNEATGHAKGGGCGGAGGEGACVTSSAWCSGAMGAVRGRLEAALSETQARKVWRQEKWNGVERSGWRDVACARSGVALLCGSAVDEVLLHASRHHPQHALYCFWLASRPKSIHGIAGLHTPLWMHAKRHMPLGTKVRLRASHPTAARPPIPLDSPLSPTHPAPCIRGR